MTDAKAYLQQVKLYDTHINNKLAELSRLKALSTQITSTIKDVPAFGGGSQDKLGNIVAKIVDLESEINEAVDAYIDKQREIGRLLRGWKMRIRWLCCTSDTSSICRGSRSRWRCT